MADDNIDITKIPLKMVKEMMKQKIDSISKDDIVEFKSIFTNFESGESAEIIYEIEIYKNRNMEIKDE